MLGAVAVLAPLALVPVIVVWLLCVLATGYVGLATMLGTLTLPIYFATTEPLRMPLLAFGLVMAVFVVFTHRANVQRMRAGSENRARRLWLLRPR
jgi:acyl phosphate:glycerol-3-phosphate acyltransferase